jgi:predicted ATPase
MKTFEAKHYLLSAEILWEKVTQRDQYPYAIPAISMTEKIELHPKVTFLVGENGSGKSTLIESIAVAWGFNPEGGTVNHRQNTRASHSDLYKSLRLVRAIRRPKFGFFLRAESLFNIATEIDEIGYMETYGDKSLHEQSHGESFIALLKHKFRGNGLYILDEPEAALSPQRQLSMLVRMHDLIGENSQFIIATHSPILMAYPDAWIYHVTPRGLERVEYTDTEHFQVTRSFLNNHEVMLRQVLRD